MKGFQVNDNTSGKRVLWCGPAALSAAVGISTDRALDVLKGAAGKVRLQGVTTSEMIRAVDSLARLKRTYRYPKPNRPTLARWLSHNESRPSTYLVLITDHWICVKADEWVDNKSGESRHVSDCPYLRKKVVSFVELNPRGVL